MANSAENTKRKEKPQLFKPGQSGNPKGRPKGSHNKATIAALTLLEGEGEALTRKAVELALNGDIQALRLCLDRITPTLKATSGPVSTAIPSCGSLADQAEAIYQATCNGTLTTDEATTMMSLIQSQCKIKELTVIEERLAKLEGNPLPASVDKFV